MKQENTDHERMIRHGRLAYFLGGLVASVGAGFVMGWPGVMAAVVAVIGYDFVRRPPRAFFKGGVDYER